MTKMRELLEKVGLAKRDKEDPPTELDRQVAALRISVESIAKAALSTEDRADLLDETLSQFRNAFLTTPDEVLKAGSTDCEDEKDESDEEDKEDTEKRDPTQEENMDIEQVTKMQAEVVELQKRLDDAVAKAAAADQKIAKFEADEHERKILTKAAELVAATSIGVEPVATLLKQLDVAGVTALEGIMKSLRGAVADAQIFTELGSAAGVKVGNEIEALANDIRKSEPNLTKEQAVAKAYKQNPHLYDSAVKR